MSRYELRSDADDEQWRPDMMRLAWPGLPGRTPSVISDLGWQLDELQASSPATDLVRIAGAAYLADRLTKRPTYFTRNIEVRVAVADVTRWKPCVDLIANLLRWLTGDNWTLSLVPQQQISGGPPRDSVSTSTVARSALLSGGLDSFLGALDSLHADEAVKFIGHEDSATVIKKVQAGVAKWLVDSYKIAPAYSRFEFRQAAALSERTSRSRSLLFMSMGVAHASGIGASELVIAENGYTSLNLPLHPNRAGALSTRSTHPETFRRVNEVLDHAGLGVHLSNPFALLTKGEELRYVADLNPPNGWTEIAASTMSCSKLDGARIKGGNSQLHCGLCMPCLVRRGALVLRHY